MSVFISFSSKDRKYVSEFILEAKKKKIPVWAATKRNQSSGKDFVKLISKKIDRSTGSIVLVSSNSLNSDFINDIELPKILNKSQRSRGYKIIPLLLDDSDINDHPIFSRSEFVNSKSTSLDSLSGRQFELKISETLSEFNYVFKKLFLKYLLIFSIIFIGVFTIYTNTANLNYSPQEKAFLDAMTSDEVIQNIGQGNTLSEEDLIILGLATCDRLERDIETFIVYDFVYFNTSMYLQKNGVGGGELFTPYNMSALINYILLNANSNLCNRITDIGMGLEKYAIFQYLITEFEFKSETYQKLFIDDYYKKQETIYYFDIDEETKLENQARDTFIELWSTGCEVFLKDPDSSIIFIQDIFLQEETIEDQNMFLDEMQIITTIIPNVYCPEFLDNALSLNTNLYLLEYNFDPEF